MTSTEVAVPDGALPVLPNLPEMFDRAPDVQSPSIYVMHGQSSAVQNQIARPGEVILALGKDDTNPDFLIGGPDNRDHFNAVVISREVSYAIMPRDSDMEWINKEQYDSERLAGNRDAWTVYRYLLAIPEFDEVLPARLMLTKTGGRITAKALNTIIDRAHALGQFAQVRLSIVQRVGRESGIKFFSLNVGTTQMPATDLVLARDMQVTASQFRNTFLTENSPPIASDQPEI